MFRTLLISTIATPLFMHMAIAQDPENVIVENQDTAEVRGDWVLGARVYTPNGEMIGSIEDLILNSEEGLVDAAVVSVGGFLGFGAKEIAVEWSELELNYDANEVTLGITREEAEDAPEYSFRERESAPAPQADPGTGVGTGTTGTTGTGVGTTGTGN